MPIELKMPALSPTMEEGTLARWLVKAGDAVKSGDILAEIETDKATMEFEAIDEGTVAEILIAEGTDGVKVGTVIALIAGEDEETGAAKAGADKPSPLQGKGLAEGPDRNVSADRPLSPALSPEGEREQASAAAKPKLSPASGAGNRVKASPLARRLAQQQGIDLGSLNGSGPGGRVVKADLAGATAQAAPQAAAQPVTAAAPAQPAAAAPAQPATAAPFVTDIPHTAEKLSNMRKTVARRLTEAKQTVPHYYLTIDIRLDALLALRADLNAALEPQGIKLSVNDLLIKALARALVLTPQCNVSFVGDQMIRYHRADIAVAVSIPGGLITPIITDAGAKSVSAIATEMKALAERAKAGKLQPHEYQGGTASLSNLGMFGIKQFDAVINPPQGMIMAVGAGEKRPHVVNDSLAIATVMTASGSFDHRAIDGAEGAQLMQAFKALVENPLGMVA